jgi:single-strand selective monofunctional uracil DNA glycosylase
MLRKKLKLADKSLPLLSAEPTNNNIVTSKFFHGHVSVEPFWQKLFKIECALSSELLQLDYPASVCAIYNPIEYAAELHCQFMQKFLDGPKDLLFVGMNPGPWGACQTGVS